LSERYWIVGGSTGIGAALARALVARGDRVAVSARSADKLAELSEVSEDLSIHPLDITDRSAVERVTRAIENELGEIDVAVIGAGAWHIMSASQMDMDKIRQAVEVNYLGTLNVVEALVARMMKRGRGHIAIIASVAGYRGLPRSMAYGPTKAALINLSETLHAELSRHGILVTVINPGFVDTPMTRTNDFPMPDIITSEKAADYIIKGLDRGKFEIAFPPRFAFFLKTLRILPNWLYFRIARRMI